MKINIIFYFKFFFLIALISKSYSQNHIKTELQNLKLLLSNNELDLVITKTDSLYKVVSDIKYISELNFVKSKALIRLNRLDEFYKVISKNIEIGKRLKNDSILIYTNSMISEYYLAKNDKINAIKTLKNSEKILLNTHTNEIDFAILYGLFSNAFIHNNDTLNYEKYIHKMYSKIVLVDTLDIKNANQLNYLYNIYADYLDKKPKPNSAFKYYKKANKLSHLVNNVYLINFTRIRIAGCLNNLGKTKQALDSLKIIQTEKYTDVYVNYLMYEGFLNVFQRSNMPDSVQTYTLMFEEYKNLINEKNSKKENVVKKEIKSKNFINILLICALIVGILVVIYIFLNKNKY